MKKLEQVLFWEFSNLLRNYPFQSTLPGQNAVIVDASEG